MPSVSKAQQQAMAIAEHEPGKLYGRNKGLLKMSHSQLHDFAATKRKGLPARKKAKPKIEHSSSTYNFKSHLGRPRKKRA
jgi:hypothetical protein